MTRQTFQQMRHFVIVGSIGFLVDCSIMLALNSVGAGLVAARLVSFSVAVTVTWYLNRHVTFAGTTNPRAGREWAAYTVVNGIGAAVNMGIFFWLVFGVAVFATWPVAALVISSAAALAINFLASRSLVFRRG